MRSRQVINDKEGEISKENEEQRSRFSISEISRSLDFHTLVMTITECHFTRKPSGAFF